MAILDTFKSLFKQKDLSNSNSGFVARNYQKAPVFNPQQQLQGITYKAIDKIGQSVSVYKPIIEKANGTPFLQHPVKVLHGNPNPRQMATYFTHLWGMLDEIYGETFWYLARGEQTNRIKEVYLLNPERVQLYINNETGDIDGYVLHKNSGEQLPLSIDEVYHDKRPNPFNEYRGLSVLERASLYVDTEINTAEFTLNYIKNSASPSGIVSLPDMTQETFQQFAQKWREGYEGPTNAGKTAFIRGEQAKFQAVGATLKDVDQKVTREMAKDDVLMMFDVPKGLLGASSDKGLGRNDTESLEYIFAKHKIEPMMNRLDQIWGGIAKSFVKDGLITVSHESTVPQDKAHTLDVQTKGVNVWLTVNEVREQNGLEPLPDGDVLAPANAVAQPVAVEQKKIKVIKKKKLTKGEIAKAEAQDNEAFRLELIATNDIYERKLKAEIAKFAKQQGEQVVDSISATDKKFDDWLFDIKGESVLMAEAMTPVILELMETQSVGVAHFITGVPLELTPEVIASVKTRLLYIAGQYNEATYYALEDAITAGVAEGKSLAKVKKDVEVLYKEAEGYRAERIARTETLRTSNQTAELVYAQDGYERVKWFTNPNACEFCKSKDGDTKVIGGTFENLGGVVTGTDGGKMTIAYDDIGTPPLHPNCRCSLVPAD